MDTQFTPQLKERCEIGPIMHPRLYPILKAGPVTRDAAVNTSAIALITASRIWLRAGDLFQSFRIFAEQIGAPIFVNTLEIVARAYDPELDGLNKPLRDTDELSIYHRPQDTLSRLIGLSM